MVGARGPSGNPPGVRTGSGEVVGNPLVLVVEDEIDLRDAVVEYLGEMEFDAHGVSDGAAMRAAVAARMPAVVVLDIALPGETGLALCRWLRRETPAGIIMATAAGQPLDRVVGLELGADDYVVKPYELRELLARVRSVVRRIARAPAPLDPAPVLAPAAPAMLPVGAFRLDPRGLRLVDPAGAEVHLTQTELALVRIFAERPGRVLSRTALAELVGARGDGRAIDIAVMRLRKKLEHGPAGDQPIRTVRGEGYRLDGSGS